MSEEKEILEENIEKVALDDPQEENVLPEGMENVNLIYMPTASAFTKVEFTVRYIKEGSEEEEEAERLRNLGIGVDNKEGSQEYHYDLFVIDLKDIATFNRIEDGNTYVKLLDNSTWYVVYNYDKFKAVYEKLLSTKIIDPDEVI